ncbi:MAG: bacterioferritin, partial [Actinomycetota bacterium]|nr:bacterioferritin [Actinomycetota bacterium]
MKGNEKVIEVLNGLLTFELTAINQYFLHSRMCENWGYGRLAARLREISREEMDDAEEIIDRILFLEGVPNMQRLEPIRIGETVPEQLRLQAEAEQRALSILADGIAAADEAGDRASREFFAGRLPEEEGHLDWLETQLG